jgi:hypothetical protein
LQVIEGRRTSWFDKVARRLYKQLYEVGSRSIDLETKAVGRHEL